MASALLQAPGCPSARAHGLFEEGLPAGGLRQLPVESLEPALFEAAGGTRKLPVGERLAPLPRKAPTGAEAVLSWEGAREGGPEAGCLWPLGEGVGSWRPSCADVVRQACLPPGLPPQASSPAGSRADMGRSKWPASPACDSDGSRKPGHEEWLLLPVPGPGVPPAGVSAPAVLYGTSTSESKVCIGGSLSATCGWT